MNDQPTQPDVDAVHEELVAYLDGELDSSEVPRIERRLVEDDEFRRRLNELERAWDMLDHLPRSQVDENFTHTTLKLVVNDAEQDARQAKSTAGLQRAAAWLVGLSGAAAAALIGYFAVSPYFSRENDRLVQDLPVIENVDLYRYAESVDFLKKLESEGLFVQDDREVDDAL